MAKNSSVAGDVFAALASLEIDEFDSSVLADEHRFVEVACTLGEEVDPLQEFEYDPSKGNDMLTQLVELLSALGYTGSLDDRAAVLDYLVAEAQACRLLAHSAQTQEESSTTRDVHASATSDPDVSIAASLSRLCQIFQIDAQRASCAETVAELCALVQLIREHILDALPANPDSVLGSHLITPDVARSLSEDQLSECNKICEALGKEHALRKGMLMRRLAVTVQSFGYSSKASGDKFDGIMRGVARAVEAAEQPIEVCDALLARDWLLDLDSVSADGQAGAVKSQVKQILMGNVPDRGGRVGAAATAAALMPKFEPRGSDAAGRSGQDRSRRGGGHGHKRGGHARKRKR